MKYITDLVLGNQGATPPNGLTDGGTPIDGLGDIVERGAHAELRDAGQRAGDGRP